MINRFKNLFNKKRCKSAHENKLHPKHRYMYNQNLRYSAFIAVLLVIEYLRFYIK